MTKEIKRKGKAIGVKPQSIKKEAESLTIVRQEPTLTQRIVLAWLDKAAINNLMPSQKKYKEAQLAYMLDLESKLGKQFPQEIMECIRDNKDTATLLRSKAHDKTPT